MKAVLISIQPKCCELIASGKKTVEVRKTKPKLKTPFKCYIYATMPKKWFRFSSWGKASDESLFLSNGKVEMCDGFKFWADKTEYELLNGKVIGEFVCKRCEVFPISSAPMRVLSALSLVPMPELYGYANGKSLYGWKISDLVIYDKPKPLSDFYTWKKCNSCKVSGYESAACIYDENCKVPAVITRPPQSWRYIMEAKNEQHSF